MCETRRDGGGDARGGGERTDREVEEGWVCHMRSMRLIRTLRVCGLAGPVDVAIDILRTAAETQLVPGNEVFAALRWLEKAKLPVCFLVTPIEHSVLQETPLPCGRFGGGG